MSIYKKIENLIKESMKINNLVKITTTDRNIIKNRVTLLNNQANEIIRSGVVPKLNEKLLELIQLNMKLVETIGLKPEPVMVLFYHLDYPACGGVIEEWITTKTNLAGKVKMLAVNCDDPRYVPLYEPLAISTYPTIMAVSDNGVLMPYTLDLTPATITTYFVDNGYIF
jgi:hypothetical protein